MIVDLNKVKGVSDVDEYEQEAIVNEMVQDEGRLVMLPVDKLHPHPNNPRKKLGDLDELADSIKAKGVMQNLTVVPKKDVRGEYTIIIGHRRHAAAKKARLYEVPCVVVDMDEQEQIATMLLENIQRSDLTAYEQAKGFQMMMDFGDSVSNIVKKTGFSESTVRRRLKMAELDEGVLQKVSSRQISFGDIDKLSEIEDIDVRNKVLADIGTSNFNSSFKSAMDKQNLAATVKEMRETFDAAGLYEIPGAEYSKHSYQGSVSGTKDITEEIAKGVSRGAVGYYYSHRDTFYLMSEKEDSNKEKSKEQLEREAAELERVERYTKLKAAFSRSYDLRKEFVENYSKAKAAMKIDKIAAYLAVMSINGGIYGLINGSKFENAVLGWERDVASYEEMCDILEISDGAKALLVIAWLLSDEASLNAYDYYGAFGENARLNILYEFLESLGYEMSDEERELITGESELYKSK